MAARASIASTPTTTSKRTRPASRSRCPITTKHRRWGRMVGPINHPLPAAITPSVNERSTQRERRHQGRDDRRPGQGGRAACYDLCPGDNFRVVASTNQTAVANLEAPTGVPIVGEPTNFPGKTTEQLSIWRHLHIEQDVMNLGEGDYQLGITFTVQTTLANGNIVLGTDTNIPAANEYGDGVSGGCRIVHGLVCVPEKQGKRIGKDTGGNRPCPAGLVAFPFTSRQPVPLPAWQALWQCGPGLVCLRPSPTERICVLAWCGQNPSRIRLMPSQSMDFSRCRGTLDRRAFVRSGLVGLSSLGLADLLALESRAKAAGRQSRQ